MACINFTHLVDFMILMPLGPQLIRQFKIEPGQFGFLVSSYTFAAGLSGFVASLFVDRFDRKTNVLFFYAGFAIGTLSCAFAPDYLTLLVTRSLTGAFGGVLSSLVLSIVSDSIPLERRGTAMGVVMGAFSVASVIGVPFSLFLANQYNWHAPFIFLGIVALGVFFLVLTFLPRMNAHLKPATDPSPASALPAASSKDPFFALKAIAKNSNQLMALGFMFCLVFGQFSIIPFLSPSLVSNGGLPESQLPLIYLFGGIVAFFAAPTFGRLVDRFGRREIFNIGAIMSIPPILLVTNLGVVPVPLLLAISSSFFLVMSGRMVPAMSIISATAPPRSRGSFMSVTSSTQQLACALASSFSSLVVARDAQGRLLNYPWVGLNAVIFTGIALWLVQKVQAVRDA